MYNRHICVSAGEMIPDSGGLSAVLGDFTEVCSADGRKAVSLVEGNGERHFRAGSYCGFVCFNDGTFVEILPYPGDDEARKMFCAEFCRRCGADFSRYVFDPDTNFLEFFISVFAGETMKIIKSGVLSTYASREENMTSVQGTILFAENIRRNLVHRERLYVRHEVFTPDRAENRIIKAAAKLLIGLTANAHSSHHLNETLSYLGEVAVPRNAAEEFGKCVNTRNTRKYSTILSICRMLLDKNEGAAFTGKNIACAQLFDMEHDTASAAEIKNAAQDN